MKKLMQNLQSRFESAFFDVYIYKMKKYVKIDKEYIKGELTDDSSNNCRR